MTTMAIVETINAPALMICDVEDDNSSSNSHGEEVEFGQEKDSGVDCDPEVFVAPDDETAKKIRDVVEFYFSDDSILKNPFLLKHVKRNKEGFVSLKLISSFRKIRNLCRNWKEVSHCLQASDVLVLNKDGTKVGRVTPLPDYDETSPSKTVVAYQLPGEKVTVENVGELFSKCGDIALVRVLRRGCTVTPEIKRFFDKNPGIQAKDCGLVEFTEYSGAQKALLLNTEVADGLRVVPLLTKDGNEQVESAKSQSKENSSPKRESPKKKKKSKKSLHGSKKSLTIDDSESDVSSKNDQRSRRCSSGSLGYCSSGSSGYLSTSPADNWFLRRHSYHPNSSYLEPSTPSFASLANRNQSRGSKDRLSKDNSSSSRDLEPTGSQSPWRRRREMVSISPSAVKAVRMPRGPNDSRGFLPRLPLLCMTE